MMWVDITASTPAFDGGLERHNSTLSSRSRGLRDEREAEVRVDRGVAVPRKCFTVAKAPVDWMPLM